MGLDRVQGDLDLYWKSIEKWGRPDSGEWRDADEPMVLYKTRSFLREERLEKLVAIAEYNDLNESWWDHVDPHGTLEEVIEDLDRQFSLQYPPGELREKYGTTVEEYEARYQDWEEEKCKEREEKTGEPPEEPERPERPPAEDPAEYRENVTRRSIDISDVDLDSESGDDEDADGSGWEDWEDDPLIEPDRPEESEDTNNEWKVDENSSLVTSEVEVQRGDDYGWATVRVPEELLQLLQRMQREFDWSSERAAIEAMVRTSAEIGENFKNGEGELWPEWHLALRASKDIPHPDEGD